MGQLPLFSSFWPYCFQAEFISHKECSMKRKDAVTRGYRALERGSIIFTNWSEQRQHLQCLIIHPHYLRVKSQDSGVSWYCWSFAYWTPVLLPKPFVNAAHMVLMVTLHPTNHFTFIVFLLTYATFHIIHIIYCDLVHISIWFFCFIHTLVDPLGKLLFSKGSTYWANMLFQS